MCHRQAAISSASYPAPAWEGAAPAAPAATAASSDTVYTGQVKPGVKTCLRDMPFFQQPQNGADGSKMHKCNPQTVD